MIKLSTGDLTSFDAGGPAMKTLAESGHARILLVCLRAGQAVRDHTTPSQVTIQILRGSARIVEAGRTIEGSAGDLVIVPAGSRHRAEAIAESVLLVTLSPHPASGQYPAEHRDRLISKVPHQAV